MKLLAIETSTEACSAAILLDGELVEKYAFAPRKHAELILSMVEQLLTETGTRLTDLDTLAFGRGPGAFTGVRIATGVIQGLAYAADLPVIPVSTLAALAQGTDHRDHTLLSAIDARMGEVYWGLFTIGSNGIALPCSEEQVCRPELLDITEYGDIFGVGSGWQSYHEILADKLGNHITGFDGDCFPRAASIAAIAADMFTSEGMVTAAEALPVYLRNQVTG